MNRALVKNLISSGEFYVSNKALIKTIGPLETLVLSVLSDSETLHYTDDGWFYATAEYVQAEVNIGRKPFDACIKKLKEIGVIDTALKGLPAKSHYKLCYAKIEEIITNYIVQKEQSSLSKTDNQGCPNGTTINNLYNKEPINKKTNKECSTRNFITPTTEEESTTTKDIISYWNTRTQNVFASIRDIVGKRKIELNARIKEIGIQEFYRAIDIALSSDFLKGNNDRGWKMDFDWFVNKANLNKILEGKYQVTRTSNGSATSTEHMSIGQMWGQWLDQQGYQRI